MYFFDRYKPRPEWFQHDPYGIHGLGHLARVLVWADRLLRACAEGGEIVDEEAVRWAAALHDLGRHDDSRDPQHGERSAIWLAGNIKRISPKLTAAQMDTIDYCCRWHVPPDASAPQMTLELRCLKDADGLDRVRLGDLKPELLRTERARHLVPEAKELYLMTVNQDGRDPWAAVREAALSLGLWR